MPAKSACRGIGEPKYKAGTLLDAQVLMKKRQEQGKLMAAAREESKTDGTLQLDPLRRYRMLTHYRSILEPEKWKKCAPKNELEGCVLAEDGKVRFHFIIS